VQQAELLDRDLEDHKDQLELRVPPDHKVFQLHVQYYQIVVVVMVFNKMQNTELTWQ
jgi:hypothetical protein